MMKPFIGDMDIAPFCMLIGIDNSKNGGGIGVCNGCYLLVRFRFTMVIILNSGFVEFVFKLLVGTWLSLLER